MVRGELLFTDASEEKQGVMGNLQGVGVSFTIYKNGAIFLFFRPLSAGSSTV